MKKKYRLYAAIICAVLLLLITSQIAWTYTIGDGELTSIKWGGDKNLPTAILFSLLGFFSVLHLGSFFEAERCDTKKSYIWAVVVLFIGLVLRYLLLPAESGDYTGFLKIWAEEFRQGGWWTIKDNSANYTAPYLYFIYIITRFNIPDLYLYKFGSVFFDVLLVFAAMRLCLFFKTTPEKRRNIVLAVFLLPTVFINSAGWGQCDVIYTFFCIMCLVYVLEGRPVKSMLFAGIAFAIKLQAIFFLPVIAIFWFAKKLKIKHTLAFFFSFVVLQIPALLSGASLKNTFGVYLRQTEEYNFRLNLNSASMFGFFNTPDNSPHLALLSNLGVLLAAILVVSVLVIAGRNKEKLTPTIIVLSSLVLSAGIPFFLPFMHERYFFVSEILCVIIAILSGKWYIILISQAATLGAYYTALCLKYTTPLQLAPHSALQLTVLIIAIYWFLKEIKTQKTNTDNSNPLNEKI